MSLDRKTLELVAIGASVALNCESSQETHVRTALEAGAILPEIQDSIKMGMQVRQERDDIIKGIREELLDDKQRSTDMHCQS